MNSGPTYRPEDASTRAVNGARVHVYRWLSRALCDPATSGFDLICNPANREAVQLAAELLRTKPTCAPAKMAPGEQPPARLDPRKAMASCRATPEDRAAEYQRVFGLVTSKECPPYESEYCPQTFSVYRSQRMADVAGYYRAFGLAPSREQPERPDHITLQLEFLAWLVAKEDYARSGAVPDGDQKAHICHDAQRRFLEEHLAWWAPAFAWALQKRADELGPDTEPGAEPQTFYARVGTVLAAFIACERGILQVAAPTELLAPEANSTDSGSSCGGCTLATSG